MDYKDTMEKYNKFKLIIIFLIIGFFTIWLTGCSLSKNFLVDLPFCPIELNIKLTLPDQVAFNIGQTLPLKINFESKSYSIYPLILDLTLSSSYQYVIDPYTSFMLSIDNLIFFPKYPHELRNTGLYDLLLQKNINILILQPFPTIIRLIYFLPSNVENKKLALILNVNGKVYFYNL